MKICLKSVIKKNIKRQKTVKQSKFDRVPTLLKTNKKSFFGCTFMQSLNVAYSVKETGLLYLVTSRWMSCRIRHKHDNKNFRVFVLQHELENTRNWLMSISKVK
jgi:hypothetical protein